MEKEITEITDRPPQLMEQLLEVWERSVRAPTCSCLTARSRRSSPYVPQARGFYERMGFHVCQRSELDEQGRPYPILNIRL